MKITVTQEIFLELTGTHVVLSVWQQDDYVQVAKWDYGELMDNYIEMSTIEKYGETFVPHDEDHTYNDATKLLNSLKAIVDDLEQAINRGENLTWPYH